MLIILMFTPPLPYSPTPPLPHSPTPLLPYSPTPLLPHSPTPPQYENVEKFLINGIIR
ncbi:MAG: hypothetical protein SWX82_28675 [Cyanobacteriota bacterium]|nr:hypothetical protein [Cyanobacteriota bacterium]